jgi:Rrf2 family nitric oxide-sensitive transcriptional repressor
METRTVRLTEFTDFGLRAMMRLAAEPNRLFTTEEISEQFGISRHHLIKIFQHLSRSGYIVTFRGAGGGVQLSRPPQKIRLGELVQSLEQKQALVECFRLGGGACSLTPSCRLKGKLATAEDAFYQELDRSTLADCVYRPHKHVA